MDWLSQNNRPMRDLEFYQRKALSFLFSSEGKDDLRCLNIPFAQLGFFSPMHFLSLIPAELCEPYRNDKLFLASSGTVRKGDKVLLLDKDTEGVLRSAIFKGRRVIKKTGATEILLDGHRGTFKEEEVVPYKEHLRQHLGSSLLPESNYAISPDGVLEWEDPTWEAGQEVYYKPEKRWATILSQETSTKGRNFVVIKLDESQTKKEKTTRVSLNDLIVHSVPARIPKRANKEDSVIASSSASAESSVDEPSPPPPQPILNGKACKKTSPRYAGQETDDSDDIRAIEKIKPNDNTRGHHPADRQMSSPINVNETIYAELLPKNYEEIKTPRSKDKGFSFPKSFLRKKPSKSSARPVSEFIPTRVEEQPARPLSRNDFDQDIGDGLKSKSCNNLNISDEDAGDMEQHFELVNYTNSLRSSARKIIQKQLAREAHAKTASLKDSSTRSSISRPHVAEIFTVSKNNNSSSSKMHQQQHSSYMDQTSFDDGINKPVKPMRTKNLKQTPSTNTSRNHNESSNYNYSSNYQDPINGGPENDINIPSTYISTIFSSPTICSMPSTTHHQYSGYASTTPYTRSNPFSIPPMSYYSKSPLLSTTAPTPSIYSKSFPTSTIYSSEESSLQAPLPRSTYSSSSHLPAAVETSNYLKDSTHSFTIAPYSNSPLATTTTSPIPQNLTTTGGVHPSTERKYNLPPLPSLDYLLQKTRVSPLDFKFAPLSSSELVKKQVSTVPTPSKPQEREKNVTSEYIMISPKFNETTSTGISSDSSGHDNDSGRGSYRQTPDIDKLSKGKSAAACDVVYETSPKNRRHPAFEMFKNAEKNNSSLSTDNKGATIDNNLQRRYTKNRALSKHSLAKYINSTEDEEEYKTVIPPPYNPTNLEHVAGYGKGIQGTENSSYADATLYALFACSNIFDMHLLFSKPGQVERGLKKDVRTILCNKIVTPLRTSYYCKGENVTHLREAMLPLSSKMHSSLIDAEEFLYLLFDSALNIESFIELSNGTKDYVHQIIARPKDRSKSQTVQFMLEASMGSAGQAFKYVPTPALFLCMPRCKGRLVYYEAVIPSLQLNITKHLQKGPKQCVCEMAATLECVLCHKKNGEIALDYCNTCKGIADQIHHRLDHSPVLRSKSQKDEILNLHSIICTRGNRYVAFVKASEHRLSPWLFYDPMAGDYPEVTLLEDFGRWLDSLEKQPGSFREFAKLHPLLKKIMTDGHIYIYSKAHVVNPTNFASECFSI